jgi:hypothetical protein
MLQPAYSQRVIASNLRNERQTRRERWRQHQDQVSNEQCELRLQTRREKATSRKAARKALRETTTPGQTENTKQKCRTTVPLTHFEV